MGLDPDPQPGRHSDSSAWALNPNTSVSTHGPETPPRPRGEQLTTGLDVHEATVHATRLDEKGKIVDVREFAHTRQGIDALLRAVPAEEMLVLEAGSYSQGLCTHLRRAGRNFVMAHPNEVRRHAPRRQKSDSVDSHELAKQYNLGLIKPCYVPNEEEGNLRSLIRHRIGLGRKTARVKIQIQSLLARCGVHHEYSEEKLFTRLGYRFLENVKLPPVDARRLAFHLEELALLKRETDQVDHGLADLGKDRQDVQLLMTIPGVDYYGALVVLAELGDPKRFPSEKKVASYAGLVPRLFESGASGKHLGIHREGPAHLRWILVCLTTTVIMRPENQLLRAFYARIQRRAGAGAQGRNKAKVATARKLLIMMWRMLITREPYRLADERLTVQKCKRMRQRARSLPAADVKEAARRLRRLNAEKHQELGGE